MAKKNTINIPAKINSDVWVNARADRNIPINIPEFFNSKLFIHQKKQIRNLLEESVKSRLVSDVPLGTFLSGGIDSSIISGIAKKYKDELAEVTESTIQGNPIEEKMLLDRSRRVGQELQNEVKRGNLFPTVAGQYVISRMGVEIAAILETLPAKITRRAPKMTASQLDNIREEISKARNIAADVHERFDEFLEEHYAETEA